MADEKITATSRIVRYRIPALQGYYKDHGSPDTEQTYYLSRNLVKLMRAYLVRRYPEYLLDVALVVHLGVKVQDTPDTVPVIELPVHLDLVRDVIADPKRPWATALRAKGANMDDLIPDVLDAIAASVDSGFVVGEVS